MLIEEAKYKPSRNRFQSNGIEYKIEFIPINSRAERIIMTFPQVGFTRIRQFYEFDSGFFIFRIYEFNDNYYLGYTKKKLENVYWIIDGDDGLEEFMIKLETIYNENHVEEIK